MNAANAQLEIELCRFFTEVSHDANTRVVIVTGQGKAFSAGGDFAYIQEMMDQPARFLDTMPYSKRLIFSMLDCSKPVIAKINGHAMGLGATLALFCDVTFAADTVRIADPPVPIGFVAGRGGDAICPQQSGSAPWGGRGWQEGGDP